MKKILFMLVCLLGSHVVAVGRPNFVFLFTDDQSYKAMGCMGNTEIHTPNMDQLGAQGVIFDRHYNTTAICMASRASVMTGLLEYKHGCNFQHGSMTRAIFSKSYPVLLQQAGYYTGFAGKFGFAVTDEVSKNSGHNSYDQLPVDSFDDWAGGVGQTDYQTSKNEYIKQYADTYPHSTRAYGAWAIDFIEKAKGSGKPFCMSLFFKASHLPFNPDPFFDDLYEGKTFSKPANFGPENGEHLAEQPKQGRQYLSYHKKNGYFTKYDEVKRGYYQLISGVDYAIGMVRAELEKQGLAENTVIIFSSDNGYSEGVHGFSGKCLPYEEPSRSPMIIYDPRRPGNGARTPAVTAGIDVAPTLLDLAGLPIPANMDGKSLLPLLENKEPRVREFLPLMQLFGSAPTLSLAVVSEDWKYIYWAYEDDGMEAVEELFLNSKDPREMTNLAADPESRQQLEEMRSAYDAQLVHWKGNALNYNDYAQYADVFNREIEWDAKKDLYHKSAISNYKKELKSKKEQ
ncbi:sulfatase family protein [Pontiella sulfatireligans]|uniref:Arylsulfatase n=1 Tax=Pontiella sulfatireligans TaxID=2750658 RepID=A0A6C2UGC3_9BACT|nr:sulfatase [Pontiella sulfatireligans]SPS74302.1 sulfatase S1_25 [Kiritimatiellales bacterium]VGO19230.1 Arylsulfatase [Pontiella sulfatireligans]